MPVIQEMIIANLKNTEAESRNFRRIHLFTQLYCASLFEDVNGDHIIVYDKIEQKHLA